MPARRPARRMRKGKKALGRRRGRRMALMPHIAGPGQYATITETFEATDVLANTVYNNTFDLVKFVRASTVAAQFAWYRAKEVIYSYEPLFNTFIADSDATTLHKPYIYTVMNRQQNSLLAGGLSALQQAGARPKPLVGRTVVRYKPNWCSPGLVSYTTGQGQAPNPPVVVTKIIQQGLKPQYGWLAGNCSALPPDVDNGFTPINQSTNATTAAVVGVNMVQYNGHVTYIDQLAAGNETTIARLTVTVCWEFKGAAPVA